MPKIQLLEGVGLGLIIAYPSGVIYSNQTGGTACLHPELEGVFIPLGNDLEVPSNKLLGPQEALADYFEGPKHQGTGATTGLDAEDAEFIDGVLRRWGLIRFIELDRGKLKESHEAWVYVRITADENSEDGFLSLVHGFGPYPRSGVLTWQNSD